MAGINLKYLSGITGIEPDTIYRNLVHPKYRTFSVPKKSGGKRTIHAPSDELKYIQKITNEKLNSIYSVQCHPSVFGFVKKYPNQPARDILTNATMHVGKKYVWNIDLEDFFHSITTPRIYKKLTEYGMSTDSAKALALVCSFDKKLPMGAPTSPVLSNMVCANMDWQMKWFCEDRMITYSRYADDLTFSCNHKLSEEIRTSILQIIKDYGFSINTKKERMQSCYGAQWVTGIKVNEKPNVCRTYIRNLRAILHDVKKNGMIQAAQRYHEKHPRQAFNIVEYFRQSVTGKIIYVGYVKGKSDPVYKKLMHEWKQLQETDEL
jgi:RNA-directed DNA polymerase